MRGLKFPNQNLKTVKIFQEKMKNISVFTDGKENLDKIILRLESFANPRKCKNMLQPGQHEVCRQLR